MSQETDRVAVPTNGRGPHPAPAPDAPPADATPAAADATRDDDPDPLPEDVASLQGYGLSVTPTQLAVGFGIVASLILLIAGRRRGRRDG